MMLASLDGWMWLFVHAAAAIVSLEAARRMVLAALPSLRQPELITDVWAPLAMVVPLLFLIPRMTDQVTGIGWMVFGAPPAVLVMAVGVGMIVGGRSAWSLNWMPMSAVGAGILLLLLGAAHDATLWVGQCAFAIAALLLWINTPAEDPSQPSPDSSQNVRAGVGIVVMIVAAVAQGIALLMMPTEVIPVAAAVTLAAIIASLAAAARLAGPSSGVRTGGWMATFGILFGLGLISLKHLLPHVFEAMQTGHTNIAPRVANGFGRFAWEATAMMAVMAIALVQHHLPPVARRVAGIVIMLGAAGLISWRLSSM